jgi:CO/xanthine dehydrogenase Mo-binding subunit
VELILSASDIDRIEERRFGDWVRDQPLLAYGTVRYAGEPVAVVAADTRQMAIHATTLVDLEIAPLEAVTSIDDALRPDAPVIHQGPYRWYGPIDERMADCVWLPEDAATFSLIQREDNICYETCFEEGDVEADLASAEWVHEATYEFPSTFQCPMEPHTVTAWWESDELHVYVSHQMPFKLRAELAELFDMDESQVHVKVPYVGGSYGAKWTVGFEALAAEVSADLDGRPANLMLDLEGVFHTSLRNAARVFIRTGVSRTGAIVARHVETTLNGGAYDASGLRAAYKAGFRAIGPYRTRSFRSTVRAVYTNRVPGGAFRGFGGPQVIWAVESATDEIAHKLGIPPTEFRELNFKERGEPYLYSDDAGLDTDLSEGLLLARKAIDSSLDSRSECSMLSSLRTGVGFATGTKDAGGFAGMSEASASLRRDGSFVIRSASVELGQGAESALTMIAADVLGCTTSEVTVAPADTDDELFDNGSVASRTLVFMGNAVADAATKLRALLSKLPGDQPDSDEGSIRVSGKALHRAPGDAVSAQDLFEAAIRRGIVEWDAEEIRVGGAYRIEASDDPARGWRGQIPFYEVSHSGVRLNVDPETGEIHLVDVVSVTDVGRAIHRDACIGQDEGCVAMGIGHTLVEDLQFSPEGTLLNANLADYHVPVVTDLPRRGLTTILIEHEDGPGYRGAKGASEGGILGVAPAIANALYDATGIRMRSLPIRPVDLWRALQSADSAANPITDRSLATDKD